MRELPKVARERLAAGPPPAPHLDSNLIAAFVEHALLPGERQRVIAHMAICEQCRAEVQLVISATHPEARDGEAVRALAAESASRKRGFSWQRLLRWQPMTAAAGILAISLAFWVATRQPMSRGMYPAVPATVATKVQPLSSPPKNSTTASASLHVPAPSGEAKQTLARALSSSHEGAANSRSGTMKSSDRETSNELTDKLVSGKAQSPELLQTEARQTEALVVAAPPPPAPAPESVSVSAAPQPAAQAPSAGFGSQTASPRGVQRTPAARSLERDFTAASAMAPRKMALLATESGVRWAVSTDKTSGQPIQGAVEKSLDGGRTWQPVPIAQGVTFRIVFGLGHDVWAGGAAGAFYHSSDGGEHWSSIQLAATATAVGTSVGDIVSIQFADPAHGVVSTSTGVTWTTSDGGQTWQQSPQN